MNNFRVFFFFAINHKQAALPGPGISLDFLL